MNAWKAQTFSEYPITRLKRQLVQDNPHPSTVKFVFDETTRPIRYESWQMQPSFLTISHRL